MRSESGPWVNFTQVKAHFPQGDPFCLVLPAFGGGAWKAGSAWLWQGRAPTLPTGFLVMHGLVPVPHVVFEVVQITPDTIWRPIPCPSALEGVCNLNPRLLSCSWNNSYCFCQGEGAREEGERGAPLQTLVKKEAAWIYILMGGILLWDI